MSKTAFSLIAAVGKDSRDSGVIKGSGASADARERGFRDLLKLERQKAQERQDALLHELNHRVKNTLSTVQSLAMQTLRDSSVSREIREKFEGRLLALSKTHDQLTRANWERADLAELIGEILQPYAPVGSDRVRFAGEPIRLLPQTALALGVVLHELAINAAAYGAFSVPEGAVAVSWRVMDSNPTAKGVDTSNRARRLQIQWQESGGPPVNPPTHRGFGSRLLERGITTGLQGHAQLSFDPAGVRCVMEISLPPDKA